MTRRAELLALAERVEATTKPDRELDGLIYMTIRSTTQRLPPSWKVLPDTGQIYAWNRPPPHAPGSGGVWAQSPRYTASIDAAASLVPPELAWTLGRNIHYQCWAASANRLDNDSVPQSVAWGQSNTHAAIALTAAALRARAEEAGES